MSEVWAEEKIKKFSKNCGDDVRRYRIPPIICRRSLTRRRPGSKYFPRTLRALMALVCFCFFSSFIRHALSRHGQTTGRTKFRATTGRISCDKKKIGWHCLRIVVDTAFAVDSYWRLRLVRSHVPQSQYGDLSRLQKTTCYARQQNQNRIFIVFFPIESDP